MATTKTGGEVLTKVEKSKIICKGKIKDLHLQKIK